MKKNKYDVFVWSTCFSEFNGEGLLARRYLEIFLKNYQKKVFIKSIDGDYFYLSNKFFKKKINKIKNKNSFFSKYIYPFYGVFLIWQNYLNGKKIIYLNYLPLWNFLIFLFLPKSTMLGPITGYRYVNKVFNISSFFRKKIFPLFFKISLFILFKKNNNNLVFATNSLKYFINKKYRSRCIFNFVFLFIDLIKKNSSKDIDLAVYIRAHPMKNNDILIFLVKKLKIFFKIVIFGEKIKIKNVKNYHNVNNDYLKKILARSKFVLSSQENNLSLFNLDCISSGTKIFVANVVDKNLKEYFQNFFISVNYENLNVAINKIKQKINSKYYLPIIFNKSRFRNIQILIKKKIIILSRCFLQI